MSMPYESSPTDKYKTDGEPVTAYSWSPTQQPAAPIVPYTPAGLPDLAEREAQRERRAVTLRVAIALTMAIPLTGIAASTVGGGFSTILAMMITWIGIAVVVYLSNGKGFPFSRS